MPTPPRRRNASGFSSASAGTTAQTRNFNSSGVMTFGLTVRNASRQTLQVFEKVAFQ